MKRTAAIDPGLSGRPKAARAGGPAAGKRPAAQRQAGTNAQNPRPSGQAASPKRAPTEAVAKAAAKQKRPGKAAPQTAAPKEAERAQEDMFLEEWDVPSPKAREQRRRKRRSEGFTALNMLLLSGIVAILAMGGVVIHQHGVFMEMKRVVEAQTFYEGTTVENVDVSRMTLSDARSYWQDKIEPGFADRAVVLDGDETVTARELGYQSDYDSVLYQAWSAGRRGSLEERYRAAKGRQYHPVAYSVNRTLYSENLVDAFVMLKAEQIDKPAKDAGIASFDMDTYTFVFSESEPGSKLDTGLLRDSITRALDAGGGEASLEIETLEPELTTDEAATCYGMITSAVTNASSSSSNRLSNIKLAASIINGTCLKPGETFSFNGTVGQRTRDRGFKVAPAYSGGTVTEEVGGGICQVSTTLFNAAVKADLEIVERHNHSLTVSYVDKGKDATVNWGGQDLKFTNTTGDDIYICCLVGGDKRVRFGIFGRLLPNGETITVEGVTTGTIKYDTEYQPSVFLAPGETKVIESGKDGYTADTYKLRWDAEGNLISRDLLCTSRYRSRTQVVQYGA